MTERESLIANVQGMLFKNENSINEYKKSFKSIMEALAALVLQEEEPEKVS
jgi:hypothetical protein